VLNQKHQETADMERQRETCRSHWKIDCATPVEFVGHIHGDAEVVEAVVNQSLPNLELVKVLLNNAHYRKMEPEKLLLHHNH
jgi:hypothetical protein